MEKLLEGTGLQTLICVKSLSLDCLFYYCFYSHLNLAIAKFTGDERQQPRRRTCVPQVAVNAAASVGSADSVVGDPEGWKI